MKLNDQTGQVERVGGMKYTIKDGIVYDARKLLADVAAWSKRRRREAHDDRRQVGRPFRVACFDDPLVVRRAVVILRHAGTSPVPE